MGQIKRSIPANSDQSVATQGNVVYIVQASAGFTLEIGSERFDVQQGDKLQVAGGYTSLRLINPTAAAVDVEIVATNGDFHRSQIASAVTIQSSVPIPVNIAAQTLSQYPELRSGKTFISTPAELTSQLTSANNSLYFALSNPAGSGKTLINPVVKLAVANPASGANTTLLLYLSHDPAATIQANLTAGAAGTVYNKNQEIANAPVGVVSSGYIDNGSGYGEVTNPGSFYAAIGGAVDPANQPTTMEFEQGGFVIGPGVSLIYRAVISNINQGNCTAQMEWIEEPV